jgi:hypothetical protein
VYSTQYVSYWPIVVKILSLYSIVEQLLASVVAVAEMQLFPVAQTYTVIKRFPIFPSPAGMFVDTYI